MNSSFSALPALAAVPLNSFSPRYFKVGKLMLVLGGTIVAGGMGFLKAGGVRACCSAPLVIEPAHSNKSFSSLMNGTDS